MAVEARFYVTKTTKVNHGGTETICTIELKPVINGEPNKDWSKWTPSGLIELSVTNEAAAEWFESHIGKPLAITFDDV